MKPYKIVTLLLLIGGGISLLTALYQIMFSSIDNGWIAAAVGVILIGLFFKIEDANR